MKIEVRNVANVYQMSMQIWAPNCFRLQLLVNCGRQFLTRSVNVQARKEMSKQHKQHKKENKPTGQEYQKNECESPFSMDKQNNILMKIHGKPGAKKSCITDVSVDGIGVQINAPPTEGEANVELLKYLSQVLGVRKNNLTLEKGFKSRQKTLKLSGTSLTKEQVEEKIRTEINDSN